MIENPYVRAVLGVIGAVVVIGVASVVAGTELVQVSLLDLVVVSMLLLGTLISTLGLAGLGAGAPDRNGADARQEHVPDRSQHAVNGYLLVLGALLLFGALFAAWRVDGGERSIGATQCCAALAWSARP